MIYYIRFLKPAKLSTQKNRKATIKCMITVTTDLGDAFYPGPVELRASIDGAGQNYFKASKVFYWQRDMRALKLELSVDYGEVNWPARLNVEAVGKLQPRELKADNLPEIVSVRSDDIDIWSDQGEKRVTERYWGTGGQSLSIWEELGESIARHIWDAGVALAAYFQNNPEQALRDRLFPQLHDICSQTLRPRVIELGSGCGIVGISLAQRLPNCDLVLTDLPEAMEILEYNISKAKPVKSSSIRAETLNWDEPLPRRLSEDPFNLILVSDCTYNSDSIPTLVVTMSRLMARSPNALIIVSMKVRHSSEDIFFDLMKGAGLGIDDHFAIPLPSNLGLEDGELENVEIYVFKSARPAAP